MAFSDVSQKYDVIIRIFEILKYQNFPALTVWPIVPITLLILNNHQSGRLAAKNSNSAEIAFLTFWSNVTILDSFLFFFHLVFRPIAASSAWLLEQRHRCIQKLAGRSYSALRLKFFADIWSSSAFRGTCMHPSAVFAMFWHGVENFCIKESAAES